MIFTTKLKIPKYVNTAQTGHDHFTLAHRIFQMTSHHKWRGEKQWF